MTDVVKLDPLLAGNVTFISTICNTAFTGIMGYISDTHPINGGRRLPYMRLSILPMAICLIMFFTVIDASKTVMILYYTFTMTLLMIAHTCYMIPYDALGAELSVNSGERNSIRSYARLFQGFGNLIGVVFIFPITAAMQNQGLSTGHLWQITIAGIAVIGALSQFATCLILSGRERIGNVRYDKRSNIFKEYIETLKLKPMLLLLIISLIISIANVFGNSGIAYFMKYNLGIAENSKALILGIMTVTGIALTPIFAKISRKYDKK